VPKPNFLCIGTQRSATTFLHTVLSEHPEIVMPKEGTDPWNKEQHFFNKEIRNKRLHQYEEMFKNTENKNYKRIGEITPAYCTLPYNLTQEISKYLNPCHTKIILIIRNPMDRIISNFKLFKRKKGCSESTIRNSSIFDFVRHVEKPGFVKRTNYPAIINNWSNTFGSSQFKTLTFEEITSEPITTLQDVARFLEVDPNWFSEETVALEKVHTSPRIDLPPKCLSYLAWRWLPMVQKVNAMCGGRVEDWVRDLQRECQGLNFLTRAQFRLLGSLAILWNAKQVWRLNRRFKHLTRVLHKRRMETS